MIPVMQNDISETGNCFSACIASLLELPISDVPNFFQVGGADNLSWWEAVRSWLATKGYGVVVMSVPDIACIDYLDGVHIVSGKSPRGDRLHATLYEMGKMVHDPHPANLGIETIVDICFLYPLCPHKQMLSEQDQ